MIAGGVWAEDAEAEIAAGVTVGERPCVSAEDVVERALGILWVDLEDVAGRTKRREVVR